MDISVTRRISRRDGYATLFVMVIRPVMKEPSPDELALFLASVPIFSSVSEETLHDLVPHLEWVELSRGDVLFNEGDAPDRLYVVVFGRLLATVEESSESQVVGEITRGEYLGEMGFMTDEPRSATVKAVRNSYLVSLQHSAFETLVQKHPDQLTNITKLLINRLRSTMREESHQRESSCYAFVPLSDAVDIRRLTRRIVETFPESEAYELLGAREWRDAFCSGGMEESFREPEFLEWLYHREEAGTKVLFECEPEWSEWNRCAVQNADRIFLVGMGPNDSGLKPIEHNESFKRDSDGTMRQELVLLWPGEEQIPRGTADWLAERSVARHYHVRVERSEDLERLSRYIRNRSVGLALGGGGARGLAHAGVLKALNRADVAIDCIGGTSIGAILGALWILTDDVPAFVERLREEFISQGSMLDYTLPVVSLCRGRNFIELLDELFGSRRIEDLPIPFFCVSTNLSTARTRVHERGELRRWILASIAIPVIGPPVLDDGDLLVDGGVLNNLPIDEIQKRVNGPTIGVNVSPSDELRGPTDRIEPPSPYELAGRKLLGLGSSDMPTIFDIIWQTSTISSLFQNREETQRADLLLEPPVGDCGLFSWDRLEELMEIGYRVAWEKLRQSSIVP